MTIKISQLTALESITNTTLMAVVDTSGPYITKRINGAVLRDFFAEVATTGNTAQLTVNSSLVPISDSMYNLGSANIAFNEIHSAGTNYASGQLVNTSGIASISTATGAIVVTGGIGVSGTVSASSVTATNLTGTIATASQPNITAVGNLDELTVDGNVYVPSNSQLHIGYELAAPTFPNALITLASDIDTYQQVVMQNISAGESASSDFIAVANTGDDENLYIDMGINSSGYANPAYNISGALDGYLYVNGGHLAVGTQTANKNIIFHTSGTQSANLRARITDQGLTVNTTTATSSITTGALVVNGGVGIAGDIRVGGNVYAGNLITTSTSTLTVSAPLVYLEADTPYPYNYDIGIFSAFTGGAGNVYQHTGLVRQESDNTWSLFSNVAEPAAGQVSLTNAIYDALNTGVHTIKGDAATKIVNGGTSGVGNIGSAVGLWNTVYATNLHGALTTPAQTAITSVGTLTGGTWNAATIGVAYGGTGVTTSTGSGNNVLSTSPTLVTPILGTPTSGTLTNCTGLPMTTGVTGTLATGNGGTGVTTSTGSGSNVLSTNPTLTSPTFTGPALGTPVSGNFSSGTFVWPTFNQNTAGSAAGLSGSPTIVISGVTTPSITHNGTAGVGDIGQSGHTFATVYATTFSGVSTTAKYADLAENYQADAAYAPGTVLMFGGANEVTLADDGTTKVAGVVSTNPAHLMNTDLVGNNVVALALTGRTPVKVTGCIRKGDLMISAGNGYARSSVMPQMGCVIGKALEDFDGSDGIIEVVVGRL